MTELSRALLRLVEELESAEIPYGLIGGLAVAAWGEPRSTLDVDVTVWTEADQTSVLVQRLTSVFLARSANPVAFVRDRGVLPLEFEGVRLDVVFARLPFERDIIERAAKREVAGRMVNVIAVEDLVLMKMISEREKDLDDARKLIRRFGSSLDVGYLEPRLVEITEALAIPDRLALFRKELKNKT
jgi:hypothetical protein